MRHKNEEYVEAIVSFIDEYRDQNGVIPTMTEISNAIGLSKGSISKYISYMREKGIVEYDSGTRTIATKKGMAEMVEYFRVPLLGEVACGIPSFAEENIEEYVKLPVSLFGRGDFFLLRAKGYSMIDAGIDDGDLILVRQQNTAEHNQIVIALIEDEATLKRYRPHPDGTIHLHPENQEMDDIVVYPDECIIQGVAVKVLKDVR